MSTTTTTTTITTELPATLTLEEPVDLAPPLLPTEQIGPKGWVRTLLFFKLAEDYNFEELSAIVQKSFTEFKNRTPVAGCEAVPLEGKQAGLLQLRHYGDEIADLAIKDLRGSFYSYGELEARGFPAAALDPDVLCMRGAGGEWPRAGDHLNVMMAQGNFIDGGLILNTLIMHAYADGTTSYKFTEILGEEFRRAQHLPIVQPVEIPWEDRAKLMQAYPAPGVADLGHPSRHPEYVELPFTPQAMPPKLLQPGYVSHIFYIAPEKIQALKVLAAPAKSGMFPDTTATFVSTNDVVTALVWRCTMDAQFSAEADAQARTDKSAAPCVVGVALDARRRASVKVHKHTIGNILGFAPAILDLPTVLEASLADLAVCVRQVVNKAGAPYLDSVTTRVQQLEDVRRMIPNMFLDLPGRNILMSSWAEFPYYDIEWGPAFGDRIRSVRFPSEGVCHSFHIRLPDHPIKGGVEVLVGAMRADMDRLLKDELWNAFTETTLME